MNIPRFNHFRVILPNNILPKHLHDLYADILRDAGLLKVYNGNPINAITESLTGLAMPGMHLKLIEQKYQDQNRRDSITTYFPKGLNALRGIDDDEVALEFRLIDGFHNYHMMSMAIAYMADDSEQLVLGEVYKMLGDIQFEQILSPNYRLINTYQRGVYSAIDGNDFKYNAVATEKMFNVRLKFTTYLSEMYYKDKCITKRKFKLTNQA